jgi:hypothetical protein
MKKLLIPIAIILAGVILVLFNFLGGEKEGELDIKIQKATLIMPAAHKVYANPDALDGQYYLFKAKITNQGKGNLEDIVVKYQIPGFIEWTELTTVGKMIPGQSVVVTCYPVFDEKITQKTTESIERVNIEVDWAGAGPRDIIEENFTFKMLNRNDYAYTNIPANEILGWADMFDNAVLLPCYVTPNDPIIKYYTQIVQEKVLKGEDAGITGKPEEGVRFLVGIYEATRMAHMVYSVTKGIPQSLDDLQTIIQHLRLPREIITGNAGICIELSIMYASVLSSAGIDPIIFLVPGHAYPGFKMAGQYFAIEATGILGEGLGKIHTAQEAFEDGMKQLEEFIKAAQSGDPRYMLVDVHELNNRGVVSMNLDDNEFLRKKVDEIAQNFTARPTRTRITSHDATRQQTQIARFPGPLSFIIPSGWQTFNYPSPNFRILIAQVASPDQIASVSVYDIPATSAQNAMQQLVQYFYQMGLNLEYTISGNNVQGTSSNYAAVFQWKGKIAPGSGGYRLVAIGADQRFYNQYAGVINSIYNSIN